MTVAARPANPRLARFATYPFVELDRRKALVAARGVEVIDLSIGDPREPTPPFIVEAREARVHAGRPPRTALAAAGARMTKSNSTS